MPKTRPTLAVTHDDFVWAAGFYEGEGSASNGYVNITQKDTWSLTRLRSLFGGNISIQGADGMNQWSVSGARGRGFIQSIYGLLSPRRQEQIRKSFQLGEFKTTGTRAIL